MTDRAQHLTSRQVQDYDDICAALSRFDCGGLWTVVRRGRPTARVRVLYRGRQLAAMARFNRARQQMRQGMLALVDANGSVDRYVSAPMLRMRW